MKKIVLLFVLPVLLLPVQSQIKVSSNNNVGIQSENPVSKLSVGSNGDMNSKVSIFSGNAVPYRGLKVDQVAVTYAGWHYGIVGLITPGDPTAYMCSLHGVAEKSTPSASGRTYGLWARAGNATNGYNHAVYAQLSGANKGAAIFACTPNKGSVSINNIYAGYFRGKVYIEEKVGIMTTTLDTSDHALQIDGTILCKGWLDFSSDERNKTGILSISQGALEKVTGLRGVSYMLKEPELDCSIQESLPDTGVAVEPVIYDNRMLYERRLSGFIAQELQQVFPDLVSTDKAGMMSINYIGLIPYLTEAIKEQQTEIEGLRQEIREQEEGILRIREELDELKALINP